MTEKNGSPAGSSFWQIIFPSLVSGILIILVGVWVVIGVGDGDVGRFAEISTSLLVLPVMISSLVFFIIFGAGIVLIQRIMNRIPPITSWILDFITKVQHGIGKVSELIVQPVIRPSALLGGLRNILSKGKSRLRIE